MVLEGQAVSLSSIEDGSAQQSYVWENLFLLDATDAQSQFKVCFAVL